VLEKKDRVIKGRKLSDKEHSEDVFDYDHDAFLGEEEAEYFDSLAPEESQRRLGVIFDKVDTDGDSRVTQVELQQWIQFVDEREGREDTEKQWGERKKGKDENHVSWDEYKVDVYGFIDEVGEEGYNFRPMMERDKRRWEAADSNQDGKLTKWEFQAFLHPEDNEHMRDILVLESLDDMDIDKDGKLSLDEYIKDLFPQAGEEGEPDWVEGERRIFRSERDQDGDGFMDIIELKHWLVPQDADHSKAEAKYLVTKADEDNDGSLSKEEVMAHYDLFVGSSATQYGEVLTRHEEF